MAMQYAKHQQVTVILTVGVQTIRIFQVAVVRFSSVEAPAT